MAYIPIDNDVFEFDRPLPASVMRILRDNITRVQQSATPATMTIVKRGSALGLSFFRATINNIAPAQGTILAVRFVGTPTAVGGSIISIRANPNSSGGVNFNAVVDNENASSVSTQYVLITGSQGGLSYIGEYIMSHWVVIPNEELVDGAVSSPHGHFRVIRDNTTIIEKREDFDSAPTTTVMAQWRLHSSPQSVEQVGEGGREYIFFGPKKKILGPVTRYIWQVEYNAIAKFSMTITPPPERDSALLIGLEAIGDGIDREDDRSIWRLGDFDFSFSNNTLHIYYHTYVIDSRLFHGKERTNRSKSTGF